MHHAFSLLLAAGNSCSGDQALGHPTASKYLLLAVSVVAIAGGFYLVLPPDGRITFAVLLGIVGGAVAYRVVLAIGWWRGSSAPTGEERGMFDWSNINLADDASRRGAVVEAIFGVCVYVVMVLAFVITDPSGAEGAIYLALVGVGISVVLWISTAAFGRPRMLLPASFRGPSAQRRTPAGDSQRLPSRRAKKRGA